MSKARLFLVSALAVFAVSGVATASAVAAPQYYIELTAFSGEESVNASLNTGTSADLVSKLTGGATIEILCSATTLTSAVIKENNKGSGSAIVYEKCKVDTPAACKVSETLTTLPVVAEALDIGTGTEVNEKFSPKESGGAFITIAVTGCSGEGNYNVTGSAECEGVNPTEDEEKKQCNFTATSGSSLKFGTNEAKLTEEPQFFLTGTNKTKKWYIKH